MIFKCLKSKQNNKFLVLYSGVIYPPFMMRQA